MGRYIEIVQDQVTTSGVVGVYDSSTSSNVNDIALLQSTNMSILNSTLETSSLDWGSEIAWPISGPGAKSPNKPRSLYMLILRSPVSGSVYVFNSVSKVPLRSMIIDSNATPGRGEQAICLDSGGLVVGNGLSVSINGNATSASDIQFKSNDEGSATQC